MKKKKNAVNKKNIGVSTKGYNPKSRKNNAAAKDGKPSKERKPLSKRGRVIVITLAALLVIATLAGIVAAVLITIENNRRIDFLNDDLSKYVTLSEDAYKGFTVKINIPAVTEAEVNNAVIQFLNQYKGDLIYNGVYQKDTQLNAGDKAYIWYRGYELSEDGEKIDFSGGCNFADENPTELTLGEGKFIVGFELGLLGKSASDTADFEKITEGEIPDNAVVYLTATCAQEVGDFYSESLVRIDFSDETLEDKWGVGIKEYIRQIGLGGKSDEICELLTPAGDSVTFTDVSVDFATVCESRFVTVECTFPHNYSTVSLRNKKVYFDVYIDKTLHYETAVFDDALVIEAGFSEEKLKEYEGENLAEKYRAKLKADLVADRELEIDTAIENAVWENMMAKAEFSSLPRGEVKEIYNYYYYYLRSEYLNNFTDYYNTFEDFLTANFELTDEDPLEYLMNVASEDTKEKIMFFYVLQKEDIVPTEQEYQNEYRRILIEGYESAYKKTREDFSGDDAWEQALSRYETQMKQAQGENYFFDLVYFQLGIKDIMAMANVVNSGGK